MKAQWEEGPSPHNYLRPFKGTTICENALSRSLSLFLCLSVKAMLLKQHGCDFYNERLKKVEKTDLGIASNRLTFERSLTTRKLRALRFSRRDLCHTA